MPTANPGAEPLPSNHSSSRNVHVLVRPSPEVLLLEPGQSQHRTSVILLCLVPVLTLLSLPFGIWQITLGAVLAPLFPGIAFAVAHRLYQRYGTKVRFDLGAATITITGWKHGRGKTIPIASVIAVQISRPREITGDGAWTSYQINLELKETEPRRVHLLDNGGIDSLRTLSKEIAQFLHVPLHDYSTGVS